MGKKKVDQNSSNQDIMKLVRAANKELHLTEGEMHAEAESIFQSVGKTLKKRREIDDHEVMTSYLKEDQNVDPAHGDTELEKRLQEQAELGKKKMSEYMDNFYRENVIQRKDKEEEEEDRDDEEDREDEEEREDGEATEDEAVDADDVEADQDENESTSVSASEVEGDIEESEPSRLPNPKASSTSGSEIPISEKETENVASNVESEICIEELPDKSIGKCFADTSNIENEVPNETLNVKDTQIP